MRAPKFQKLMNFKKINKILKDYVIKNKYKIIYIFNQIECHVSKNKKNINSMFL